MLRLRAPMSLVAVFLFIAVVAAVFVGGRIIHDWNSFHNGSPAGGTPHATLAQLEARPLQLPHVAASATCPDGPATAGVYGAGPYYGDPSLGTGSKQTAWGIYWYLVAQTDRNVTGLMLVRALDVKTQQPYVFVGQYATGTILGTDVLAGQTVQQRSELVMDTSHQPRATLSGRTLWPFTVGVPMGNSGCYGWQIDGDNFTETFVFNAGSS